MWDSDDLDLALDLGDGGGVVGAVLAVIIVCVVVFFMIREENTCAKMKCPDSQVPSVIDGKCLCTTPAQEP